MNLRTLILDIISMIVTLFYMYIVWYLFEKAKMFSTLATSWKQPMYVGIALTTGIPLYLILRRLFLGRTPLDINIRIDPSQVPQHMKQIIGTDNRYIMPSKDVQKYLEKEDSESTLDSKYKVPQCTKTKQGNICDPVESEVVLKNYHLGSPEGRQSRFVIEGEVCPNQDFVPQGKTRVRWNKITNTNPRHCFDDACTQMGDMADKFQYSLMQNPETGEMLSKPSPSSGRNPCSSPYVIKPSTKLRGNYSVMGIRDMPDCGYVNHENLKWVPASGMIKASEGRCITVERAKEYCDNNPDCGGFYHEPYSRRKLFEGDCGGKQSCNSAMIKYFTKDVLTDPKAITPNGEDVNSNLGQSGRNYVKPVLTSIVDTEMLYKKGKLDNSVTEFSMVDGEQVLSSDGTETELTGENWRSEKPEGRKCNKGELSGLLKNTGSGNLKGMCSCGVMTLGNGTKVPGNRCNSNLHFTKCTNGECSGDYNNSGGKSMICYGKNAGPNGVSDNYVSESEFEGPGNVFQARMGAPKICFACEDGYVLMPDPINRPYAPCVKKNSGNSDHSNLQEESESYKQRLI